MVTTATELLRYAKNELQTVCDNPDKEAMLLLSLVLDTDPRLAFNLNINESDIDRLQQCLNRRKQGIPLQYILGSWEFMGLELAVGEGVLCPRPDSECIVEKALNLLSSDEKIKNRPPVVLDLCAGSGALAIAIKHFLPHVQVSAVEKHEQAFFYLEKNCKGTGVEPVLCDVEDYHLQLKAESVDLIICNPPYIPLEEGAKLAAEVLCEPHTALFEPSQYHYYKLVTDKYFKTLVQGGYLIFEIPTGQQVEITKILQDKGFKTENIEDLNHTVRGVLGVKNRG